MQPLEQSKETSFSPEPGLPLPDLAVTQDSLPDLAPDNEAIPPPAPVSLTDSIPLDESNALRLLVSKATTDQLSEIRKTEQSPDSRWLNNEQLQRKRAHDDYQSEWERILIGRILLWTVVVILVLVGVGFIIANGFCLWHLLRDPKWLEEHSQLQTLVEKAWTIGGSIVLVKFSDIVFKLRNSSPPKD